jgi:hypothetical protein
VGRLGDQTASPPKKALSPEQVTSGEPGEALEEKTMNGYFEVLKKYMVFSGRARRKSYAAT